MRAVVFILFTLFAATVFSDEKKYGSFILNTDIPDTLFFIDEIKANDSFELRKALRNHDIQNIVLASPGGSVWEGLQMAGIIFDKKLRTYIPRGGTCASACSYMFFAGNERLADGELGVHQAYSSDAKKQQAVGQTQYTTQFTVSEIIGFLNEFGTPAFVYERMFQDIDMYFFDPLELMELNSEVFGLENSQKLALTKLMVAKLNEKKEKEPELSKKELIALIQIRLKEIGCNPGPADGIWGRRTQAAAEAFAEKAGLSKSQNDLITEGFIRKLAEAPNNYCPKVVVKKSIPALEGRWSLGVYCSNSNRSSTGIANVKLTNISDNQKIYFISYGNSLNKSATGTAYQKRSGKITVNLKYSGSSEVILAYSTYKSGTLLGADTTGCNIRANKIR